MNKRQEWTEDKTGLCWGRGDRAEAWGPGKAGGLYCTCGESLEPHMGYCIDRSYCTETSRLQYKELRGRGQGSAVSGGSRSFPGGS